MLNDWFHIFELKLVVFLVLGYSLIQILLHLGVRDFKLFGDIIQLAIDNLKLLLIQIL